MSKRTAPPYGHRKNWVPRSQDVSQIWCWVIVMEVGKSLYQNVSKYTVTFLQIWFSDLHSKAFNWDINVVKNITCIYVYWKHCRVIYTFIVLNLGSKKGTHFWGQKGHFLSRNLIMRAPDFAAPRRCSAHQSNICSISILDTITKLKKHDLSWHLACFPYC